LKRALLTLCCALGLSVAVRAHALEPQHELALAVPIVEIRVQGDALALARVQSASNELFSRVRVRARVRAETNAVLESDHDSTPWLIARLDLQAPDRAVLDVAEGQTRQELTHRTVLDVTSLETGVEAAMHIVYAAVEAALELRETVSASTLPPRRLAPSAALPGLSAPQIGFDLGALGRVASYGSGRFLPGGGAVAELGADWGSFRAGLMLLGAVHEATDVAFGDGYSTLRPLALRLVPVFDTRLAGDVQGVFGVGFGLDEFSLGVGRPPSPTSLGTGAGMGMTTSAGVGTSMGPVLIRANTRVILEPLVSALLGVRIPLGSGAFASLLGSLDAGLGPRSLVLNRAGETASVFELPQFRAGVVLAASFTASGAQRFARNAGTP
jgi:hypothetical protein